MSYSSEEKILGGISHLGILFSWIGIIVALVIFVTQKDKSSFVGNHAKQALGYQICLLVLFSILSFFVAGGVMSSIIMGGPGALSFISAAGTFGIFSLLRLAIIIYAVVAAFNAFTGKLFKYVLIGDFVDQV